MLLSLFTRRAAICLCWGVLLGISAPVFGQTNYYAPNGTEYAVVGSLAGDQVWPDAALAPGGGFLVWQDNITDGSGWGVSARRLSGTLSGVLSTFRVNAQGANDQQNPRVAMLQNGGAVFVWQSGQPSYEHIYARFLTPSNTWVTGDDTLVSTPAATGPFYVTNLTVTITTNWDARHQFIKSITTNTIATITTAYTGNPVTFQINPAVAVLNNGNVVVVWGSYDEAGTNSLQDVYGQILSPAGDKIGGEFLINQFTPFNQHAPAIAALTNGGFVVTWVSEQERVVGVAASVDTIPSQMAYPSVDIYARLYDGDGVAQSGEFLVNTDDNPCANPRVAVASDGSFMVAWQAHDMSQTNAWDIFARSFSSAGVGGSTFVVNTHVAGSQYLPHISVIGRDYLIVWTSFGQDGSLDGVYGQFVHEDGTLVNGEFRVNTTTISQQMQPVVAADGANQFLVVWTSFTGKPYGFDLYAQRYLNVASLLLPMGAPFVNAPFIVSNGVYQPQLQVSWPPQLGISVSSYEVYVDGAGTPMASTTSNIWTMTAANGLTANSTHSFQVDYVTTSSVRSPLSPSAAGTTWGGLNYFGIPFEWMQAYYGPNIANWPANVNAPLVPGGLTLYQVFQSGGNPLDSSTWLKTSLAKTSQGMYLSWNAQPGLTYQVQVSTNFTSWSDFNAPWFAPDTNGWMYVGGGAAGYYRVMLLR